MAMEDSEILTAPVDEENDPVSEAIMDTDYQQRRV